MAEPLYLYNDEQNHGVMRKWEETNKVEDYLEIHEADNILNVKIELVSKPKSYNLLRNIHLNKELKIITKMAQLIYNDKRIIIWRRTLFWEYLKEVSVKMTISMKNDSSWFNLSQ